MNRPTFTMLVGLPGSGKSTYAAGLSGDFTYLSTDALVEARAAELGLTYNDVWSDYIGEATRIVNEDFRAAVKAKRDIVWDQTNLSPKKRRRVLSQLPSVYRKVCRVISVNEEIRQDRLLRRPGKTIPAHVDKSMRESFVYPDKDEGFDMVVGHTTVATAGEAA
ncbi:zeta toxin [Bacteriophage DSS3_MAL1]|nr:zeta toxin [Bacteriophage DSS3_MAL1]